MSSTSKLEGVSRLMDKRNTEFIASSQKRYSATAAKHLGHSASWTIDEAPQTKGKLLEKVARKTESGLHSIGGEESVRKTK